jgi:hypothetical protein
MGIVNVLEETGIVKNLRRQQSMSPDGVTGLNFEGLLKLLVEVDALNTFNLTEKERLSVLSTQIIKALFIFTNVITEQKGASVDNAQDTNEVFNKIEPFDGSLYDKPRILVSRSIK